MREPDEHRREHVAGAALHPSSIFSPTGFPAETAGRRTLILCRSGGRAGKVAGALRSAGRTDVDVIEGGITAWMTQGLPVVRNAKAPLPIIRRRRARPPRSRCPRGTTGSRSRPRRS
ncbi:MAG: rhodanese-like domain-containing protein [Phycisphaerales bacterium]